MTSVLRKAAASYHCGTCHQLGQGAAFHTSHRECPGLQQLMFTEVTSLPPPDTLNDLVAELAAAQADGNLRVPEIPRIIQLMQSLSSIRLSHLTEACDVPKYKPVEALFEARKAHEQLAFGSMSELEAALAAFCVSSDLSGVKRQELCNLLANRGVISQGLVNRMDGGAQLSMVPELVEINLNTGEDDVRDFGVLSVWMRDIVAVVWYILCNPVFNLKTDMATGFEALYDEECLPGNDPRRGAKGADLCNSMYYEYLAKVIPNFMLALPIFATSDATNVSFSNHRSVHAFLVTPACLRAHARNSDAATALVALMVPPKGGEGLVAAGSDALKMRRDEYFNQVRSLLLEPLKAILSHGVSLPLPLDGHSQPWVWVKCAATLMAHGADATERSCLACAVNGPNSRRPCPLCKTGNKEELLEPVERDPTSTAALAERPRVPRDAVEDNAIIADAAEEAARAGTAAAALARVRAHGLRGVPLLVGMPGFDAVQSIVVDVMHTASGINARLLHGAVVTVTTGLSIRAASAEVNRLNARLLLCTVFPGFRGMGRLPPRGLYAYNSAGAHIAAQLTAAELGGVVMAAPYVFGPWPALSKLFQVWGHLYNELRHPSPDWQTARRAYTLYQHFLRAFDASTLPETLTEGLMTIKVHDVQHLIGQMLVFGCNDNLSLENAERWHAKTVKPAFRSTDRRHEGMVPSIGAAVRRMEAMDLFAHLLGAHHAAVPGRSAAVTAKWRELAGYTDTATDARELRGMGRRADMPATLKLGQLAAMEHCHTVAGRCDLANIAQLVYTSLSWPAGGPTLRFGATAVDDADTVVPYTGCMLAGAGRQACVKGWAFARPGGADPQFDFVAFDEPATDGSGAAIEQYGLLALIMTLSSVEEPLALLRMLRRLPPSAAVYALAAVRAPSPCPSRAPPPPAAIGMPQVGRVGGAGVSGRAARRARPAVRVGRWCRRVLRRAGRHAHSRVRGRPVRAR